MPPTLRKKGVDGDGGGAWELEWQRRLCRLVRRCGHRHPQRGDGDGKKEEEEKEAQVSEGDGEDDGVDWREVNPHGDAALLMRAAIGEELFDAHHRKEEQDNNIEGAEDELHYHHHPRRAKLEETSEEEKQQDPRNRSDFLIPMASRKRERTLAEASRYCLEELRRSLQSEQEQLRRKLGSLEEAVRAEEDECCRLLML